MFHLRGGNSQPCLSWCHSMFGHPFLHFMQTAANGMRMNMIGQCSLGGDGVAIEPESMHAGLLRSFNVDYRIVAYIGGLVRRISLRIVCRIKNLGVRLG